MTPEIEKIFDATAHLAPPDREQFFETHAVPTEVRREVESLLLYDGGSTEFLADGFLAPAAEPEAEDAALNQLCGSWRLVRLLGRGGMGAVYLAERVDDEVRQQVAVKLLRQGLDDPVRLHRFLRERQILATLNHPNIARLLDAGRRADGQPYFVMDYVDGRPIDEFARDLSVRQKVELILAVCDAISYAHRSLIVHRDLKPGNILVDSAGRPKILDFGIARVLEDAADTTQTGLRMMTPEYASPEQIAGAPATTAMDQYSLAAVFFTMLTGRSPHAFDEPTIGALLEAIRTREVTRPSALAPEVRGDVDAIVLKALRKEPGERYASVDDLARDLRAYLESRPISARRGEWPYRLRKFTRRYWAPLAAASMTLIGLTVGLIIAGHERDIARQRFDQVRGLADRLFDIDRQVEPLAGSVQARQTIVNTALEYIRGLQRDSTNDPRLLLELATALDRVAEVQGGQGKPNLGQPNKALENLGTAEGLINKVLASKPRDPEALRLMLSNLEAQARTHWSASTEEEAEPIVKRGLPFLNRLLSAPYPTAEDYAAAAAFSRTAAGVYLLTGPFPGALPWSMRTLEYAREARKLKPSRETDEKLAEALFSRGDILRADGQLRESLQVLSEAEQYLTTVQARYPDDDSLKLLALKTTYTQGLVTGDAAGPSEGRFSDAVPLLEKALAMSEARVARNPGEFYSHYFLSMVAWKLGRALEGSEPARALDVYQRGIRAFDGFPANHPLRRSGLRSLAGSMHCLIVLGRPAETRPLASQGFALMKALKRYPVDKLGPSAGDTEFLQAFAEAEFAWGDRNAGDATVQEIVTKIDRFEWQVFGDLQDASAFSWTLEKLAEHERRGGNIEAARKLDDRRRDYWRQWNCRKPGNEAIAVQLAAAHATASGQPCAP